MYLKHCLNYAEDVYLSEKLPNDLHKLDRLHNAISYSYDEVARNVRYYYPVCNVSLIECSYPYRKCQ